MRNKLLKAMLAVLGLFVGILINTGNCYAVDNQYTSAKDAVYATTYKDIFYNKTAGSPLEYEAENGVDKATGHLTLQRTDLDLLGTGGMDFALTRYYDSNEANIGQPSVQHVKKLDVDNMEISFQGEDGKKHTFVVSVDIFNNHSAALKDMFIDYKAGGDVREDTETDTQKTQVIDNRSYNVYGISSGWSFDFPWIETMSIKEGAESKWSAKPIYLHWGSKGAMAIFTSENSGNKTYRITGLDNYGYYDVKLEDFNKTVDGVKCRYLLRDKTGLRTYFNADGVIVLQRDAHNNAIHYSYRDKIYFDKIIDSVGREICFHYGAEKNGQRFLQQVTVQGENVDGGVSKKTISYSLSETSYKPKNGKKIYGSKLNCVTVDGSKEEYTYRTVETFVNTSGWRIAAHRADTNQAYLLKSVTCDGTITNYEYRAGTIRGTKDGVEGQKRDVATQFYYVTREYKQDAKTNKKAEGIKYDYFQKQKDRDKLVSYADGFDEIDTQQYGEDGLRNVTVISSYNPKKHKDNGRYSDYVYKKSSLDFSTLHLSSKPKKNVSLYIYNTKKMLTAEIEDGSSKSETLYSYDKDGKGSLVVQQTDKFYGKNRSKKPITDKQGFTYDTYRNLLTRKSPKAYKAKYAGKEHLFTAHYAYYQTAQGYPAEDKPFCLCTLIKDEEYLNGSDKVKLVSTIADNGLDYKTISEEIKEGNRDYRTISKTDFSYDTKGNETKGIVYPYFDTQGLKEVIENNYTYNAQGQQTKKTVTLTSAKNPEQNRTYMEEEAVYDSFGNIVSETNQDDYTTKYQYDEETGETKHSVEGVGTEYEYSQDKMISGDGLKTMSVDQYNRCMVEFLDAFGNTVVEKDEKSGTWTESTYDYGEETLSSDEEEEGSSQLVEERVYSFEPEGDNYINHEDGTKAPNYDIGGKGQKVLSGSRYIYDDYGEEIVSASFSGGAMDAAHCSAWTVTKETEDVTENQIVTRTYIKQLNPQKYQQEIDRNNYYNQFDGSVLSETVEETVTDEEGNVVSEKTTYICGEEKSETVTTYTCDEAGQVSSEYSKIRKYENGTWLPAKETQSNYQYDYQGNVIQTELRQKEEGQAEWATQTTRAEFDEQGNQTAEYSPRGVKEGYASKYEYDILGRMIREEIPLEKKDGKIEYQTKKTEYDNSDNIVATEEQQTDTKSIRTEFSYDKRGNLILVKNCLENDTAQYTQYVYDAEGNKIRQITGLTSPLAISLAEGTGENPYKYAGHQYSVNISGKKKSDIYSESKYEYNKRNELTSFIDSEGRKESYTYDEYGNLTETKDKNGNTITGKFDYQNRLTESVAKEKETGKKTVHTYQYDKYGELSKQDNTSFAYDNVSGQVTKETTTAGKGSKIEKSYAYDSDDNRTSFSVSVDGKTELDYRYEYDAFSRLSKVKQAEHGNTRQIAAYTYDEDGNLSSREATEAGLNSQYTFDYANRLTKMDNKTADKSISSYQSTYLKNGQKASEESQISTETKESDKKKAAYTYDLLGRLTKETNSGQESVSYTYDAHNNRKEMKVGNLTTAYRYNRNEELLRSDTLNTETKKDSVTLYKNDCNGNQLAKVTRRNVQEDGAYFDLDVSLGDNRINDNVVYHYNALNQLTETLTRDKKVTYEYDAEGLRTAKTVNGKKTIYIWDGDQLALEVTESGKVLRRYVRGSSLIYSDEGAGTKKQYYVMNPHGDVVQLLDENGNVTKSYEYDSFGNEVKPDKKDDNPFRYAGEYYDKETASIYLRARYYQPQLGRFQTRDTYTGEDDDPLTLHLYTYCGNDAVNNVDPSGHFFETLLDIASFADSFVSFVKSPSWENAAYLVADTVAVAVPGIPGTGILKAGKYAKKIAGLVNTGRKVATKFKTAANTVKTVGKKIGKKIVTKASTVISKGKKLDGTKLLSRTKEAMRKAKKTYGSKIPKGPKNKKPKVPVKIGKKTLIKKAQLPTKGKIRYVPPKAWNASQPLPKTKEGYIDKFGNIWKQGASRTASERFEWDVQLSRKGKAHLGWASRDGSHLNVSLKGKITH